MHRERRWGRNPELSLGGSRRLFAARQGEAGVAATLPRDGLLDYQHLGLHGTNDQRHASRWQRDHVCLRGKKCHIRLTHLADAFSWEELIGSFGSANKFYGVRLPIPVPIKRNQPVDRTRRDTGRAGGRRR